MGLCRKHEAEVDADFVVGSVSAQVQYPGELGRSKRQAELAQEVG